MKKLFLFTVVSCGIFFANAEEPATSYEDAIKRAEAACASNSTNQHMRITGGTESYQTGNENRGATNTYQGGANAGGQAGAPGVLSGSLGINGNYTRQGSQSNTNSQSTGTFNYECK